MIASNKYLPPPHLTDYIQEVFDYCNKEPKERFMSHMGRTEGEVNQEVHHTEAELAYQVTTADEKLSKTDKSKTALAFDL
ncbi:hypothetical protein PR048_022314 [Dryococelus australis]|uniref:Uncharacterized protein n=1 Tax=Dryococelus australis TaxID=614101 RepID=A0ABQ9H0S2_9NEOP|nr:hypothetical protein PR048_022314 [Dryococelus australis]